jgi:dCMP deaminase
MNAVLNKNGASVAGARVFVTMFPCNECAKLLIQAGIKEIVYHEDKAQPARGETPAPGDGAGGAALAAQYAASRRLLALAGVRARQHRFDREVTLAIGNGPARRAAAAPAAAEPPLASLAAAGATGGAAAAAAAGVDGFAANPLFAPASAGSSTEASPSRRLRFEGGAS